MTVSARLRRLSRFDALALTAVIWFLAKFLRYAFPPLFSTFQDVYGASNTVLGTAFTALMLVYAAMQFPSGAFADRLGSVKVITAGAVLAALGALTLVVPGPFVALVAGMALVGLGTGAHKTVAVRLMSTVYPARTGRALGVLDTLGAFGGVAAPALVVWALSGPGWRTVFLAGGVAGLVFAGLFAVRVPRRLPADDGGDASSGSLSLSGYATLFAERRFALFVGVTVLVSFGYNGAVAFLPLYLTDAAGLDAAFASLVYSGLFLVSVVQTFTGDLSDRTGALPVLAVTVLFAAAGLGLTLALSTPYALAAAVLLFGVGGHGYRPVRGAYLARVIPSDVVGGTLGIVRTVNMAAGAVSPAVVGYLSDTAGFRPAFAVLVVSLVLALALISTLALTEGDADEDDDGDDSE